MVLDSGLAVGTVVTDPRRGTVRTRVRAAVGRFAVARVGVTDLVFDTPGQVAGDVLDRSEVLGVDRPEVLDGRVPGVAQADRRDLPDAGNVRGSVRVGHRRSPQPPAD